MTGPKQRMADLAPELVRAIIDAAADRAKTGRDPLREIIDRAGVEADALAREYGMSEEFIAIQQARRNRPSNLELIKACFPIQSLPDGAKVIYDRDLGIAELVTKDPDGES